MTALDQLRNTDIYLLDQMIKGTVNKDQRILDAGCGSARNMRYFLENDFNILGIDPSEEQILRNKSAYPKYINNFAVSSIEAYTNAEQFDYIICNAVLHFANDHAHFNQMFKALIELLREDGILFIRMTSNIGMHLNDSGREGVYLLPDGSTRYLITRSRIDELLREYQLLLLEPVKTVKVEEWRSMTTLVLKKN